MEQRNNHHHSLQLTDRNKLSLTGVNGIDSMSDNHVVVNLPDTKLVIRGGGLNVDLLNVEEGKLVVLGEIISGLEYTSGKREKFSIGKLFR